MASDAEHTTVHVKNISAQTTESQVKDFFSFCGKISHISVSKDGEAQSAAVTFEKPTAAKTALLLDNTQLGPNLVNVTAAASLEQLSSPKTAEPGPAGPAHDVPQEDKPRSRIVAEYLAHGYTISDKAIERAIALDKQHGVSNRFTQALQQWDSKLQASERAKSMDTQYGISDKAGQGFRSFNSYFEKALGSPTGQRVRAFYLDTQKQVMDVHTEARRLADMKSGKPSAENTTLEKIPGTENTKCSCGGSEGICQCEPGKCRCASCSRNPEESKAAEAAQGASSGAPTQ